MRRATAEMIALAAPPEGFEPIVSSSNFGWENGPIFEKVNGSSWTRGFRVADQHTNAGGMCHGGMLMTFADILLSRAVLEVVQPPFVTVRLTTDFVGPAKKKDWVEGVAKVVGQDDGLVSVSGRIYTRAATVVNTSALFKRIGPSR